MDIRETVKKTVFGRVWFVAKSLMGYWPPPAELRCIVAGGCLAGGGINDVDLFPHGEFPIPDPKDALVVSRTKNATTFKCDPWPVQVCNYKKPSLEDLIRSFDFAHIQVGAVIAVANDCISVERLFITDEFIAAQATKTSWFCGSEYPLASLIRAAKYRARGDMTKGNYVRAAIDTLVATVKRGFADYDDFKDQLDAVDLGLLKDDMQDVDRVRLDELFALLEKRQDDGTTLDR